MDIGQLILEVYVTCFGTENDYLLKFKTGGFSVLNISNEITFTFYPSLLTTTKLTL